MLIILKWNTASLQYVVRFPITCSDTDRENISRNYLQDLFGSFPFSDAAGGTAFQDADISDGEYEIYEQYNGNYSDDDDDY